MLASPPQAAAGVSATAPYRISLGELGNKLASSGKADFYRARSGQVLKLYRLSVPAEEVDRYTRIACLVREAGLPCPAVDARTVSAPDGRRGMMMSWLEAPTMAEYMARRPFRIAAHARLLAQVHRGVLHCGRIAGLRSQRHDLTEKLAAVQAVSEPRRRRLFDLLGELPDGEQLCHGDFHCLNLLIATDGPWIIDWDDASYGNPLADIARSWLLMRFSSDRPWMERNYITMLGRLYLREILRTSPEARAEVSAWGLVCASSRLAEDLRPLERANLAEFVQRHPLLKGY